MLQKEKKKYTVETLKPLNVLYDREHRLTQQDVDMVNNYVELIEQTRSELTPKIGDRLVYVTEHGDYYGNARMPLLMTGTQKKDIFPFVKNLMYLSYGKRTGISV